MKSARLGAAGLLSLVALFVFSCTYPTYIAAPEDPPAPPPPALPAVEADAWALYVLTAEDAIIYEDHCLDSVWIPGGWRSREQYHYDRREAFRIEVQYHQGKTGGEPWRLVEGIIWYPGCGR